MMRSLLVCALCSLTLAAVAHAQTAEDLFREGKDAMAAGRPDEACPKFEGSYQESGNLGALLSWADCEERRGRLATALGLWQRGGAAAGEDASRKDYANDRATALAPRVPRLSIAVGDAGLSDVVVTLDGRAIEVGAELLVDPGEHRIRASAGGRAGEEHEIEAAAGDDLRLTVLARAAEEPRTAEPDGKPSRSSPPSDEEGANPLVTAGWVVGAVGAAGAIAFAATGAVVLATCDEEGRNEAGEDLEGRGCPSGSRGLLIGNAVAGGVGAAGLAVGITLLAVGWSGASRADETAMPAWRGGPGDAGITAAWSF
jgi:hypothetical protein